MDTTIEKPKYRVIADAAAVDGAVRLNGAEVETTGWPKSYELEPLNESARRVTAYFQRCQAYPFLPVSPFNTMVGDLYLPHDLPRGANPIPNAKPGSELPGPVRDDQATDAMPRYRVVGLVKVGPREVANGEIVVFLGWPPANDKLEPVNEPAWLVADYCAQHRDNPALFPSPWCDYRQALFLPELPAPPARPQPRKVNREFAAGVAAEIAGTAPGHRPSAVQAPASVSTGINSAAPISRKSQGTYEPAQ